VSITAFDFRSFSFQNSAPAVTDASLAFVAEFSGFSFTAGLTPAPLDTEGVILSIESNLAFVRQIASSDVPVPATLALLGLGLLSLGLSQHKVTRS